MSDTRIDDMSADQLDSRVMLAVYSGAIHRHIDGSWSVRVGPGLSDWAVPDVRVEAALNGLYATGRIRFDTADLVLIGIARVRWAEVTDV